MPGLSSGHYGGNLFRLVFPAIEQLPRADEDARAARGLAIPVNKELGDIAVARLHCGQDAEDSEVLDERHTHASRISAKDEDERGRNARDAQLELNLLTGVGDEELGDGVCVERRALCRKDDRRQPLVSKDGVDFDEERIA
jgi:hypothetical protein